MSLINQMLKDIDKRHAASPSGVAAHHDLSGVMHSHFPWLKVGAVLVLTGLVVLVGYVVLKDASGPAQPQVMASLPPVASPVVQPEVQAVELAPPSGGVKPINNMLSSDTNAGNPSVPDAVPMPTSVSVPLSLASNAPRVKVSTSANTLAHPGTVSKALSAAQGTENLYLDAIEQLRMNHVLEGQNMLRQVLSALPSHHAARQLLALSLLTNHELEAAIQVMATGVGLASDQPAYLAFYASLLQRGVRHEEAVQNYLLALRLKPDVANWLLGLAVSLQATQDKLSAAQAYQRALELGLSPVLSQFAKERLLQLNS